MNITRMTPHTYTPVDQCIYCDSREQPLTTEHVIPYAMGGALKLPNASCEKHRIYTQQLELQCFGQMLKEFRVLAGVQSANPPPEHFMAYLRDRDGNEVPPKKVPISEYPQCGMIPKFAPATLLHGDDRIREEGYPVQLVGWFKSEDTPKIAAITEDGRLGMRYGRTKPGLYAQALAKMALGFAVGELGIAGFNPIVRDFILSADGKGFGKFVGGDLNPATPLIHKPEPSSTQINEIELEAAPADHPDLVVVRLRLLANEGWPTNHVVVGRRV